MSDLKKLFESMALNEENQAALVEAFETRVDEKAAVKAAEKIVEAREQLMSESMEIVQEAVEAEMKDLMDELHEARTLEARYATKLVEFKEKYAEQIAEEMQSLVSEQVRAEMDELKESLEEAQKNRFGRKIFEAYQETFKEFGLGEDMVDIKDLQAKLEESEKQRDELLHEKTKNELLEGLEGKKRAVMESLLEGVATEKLGEKFEYYKAEVLAESAAEAEDEVITESADATKKIEGTVVLESDQGQSEKDRTDWKRRMRIAAGLE